jgi:hypothetical protein
VDLLTARRGQRNDPAERARGAIEGNDNPYSGLSRPVRALFVTGRTLATVVREPRHLRPGLRRSARGAPGSQLP